MDNIELPDLLVGPIRYNVGQAWQLLRVASTYSILDVSKVKISPKLSENCYQLENDERIIITRRKKKFDLPDGIQGILQELDDGTFKWVTHLAIEEKLNQIKNDGLRTVAEAASSTWSNAFTYQAEQADTKGTVTGGKEGLRPPQLGALFAIGSHWSIHHSPATIVMPTGTGKTETMLSALAAYNCSPLVVGVPSKALRDQTKDKFLSFGLLRKLHVLDESASNPVVGVLRHRPKTIDDLKFFEDCNVVVSAMSSLSGGTASFLKDQIALRCDALIIDEAHHVAASTWVHFREAFAEKKVLQFTATPFRRDGKLVGGDVIYSYPLRSAQHDGYFKNITFKPIHEFSTYSSDTAIADEAVMQLQNDLENGYNHLIMARCESISRAMKVHEIYNQRAPDFLPLVIHSELNNNPERLLALREGRSRIAICVNMLGEGFDLPELKIAAIHDPHKSLSVILQFTGRFTRSAGKHLGDATVIANIADTTMSASLERLYSEDSDWNSILSEMSSNAAKEHAELIKFLNDSKSINQDNHDVVGISHHLLHPKQSTLFYHAPTFSPKRFHEGIPRKHEVMHVWFNDKSNTLFFVTRSTDRVQWSRSKELIETGWELFVLHHDRQHDMLYLNSSDKSSNFESIAHAVGATEQVSGEQMFRCLGNIRRLVFQNLGVSKHGRRNLSYAMYTGENVRQALTLSEKAGSRKSNLSGDGWENGKQISIGCSYKGRVWSRTPSTIPQFVTWAESIGKKLLDDTISTEDIIDNVLIPEEVNELPNNEILGIEWPIEILKLSEAHVSIEHSGNSSPIYLYDLQIQHVDQPSNDIFFDVINVENQVIGQFALNVGGDHGFSVRNVVAQDVFLQSGARSYPLHEYFNDYPPLIRYIDLSELDGNLIINPKKPENITIPTERFEAWDWSGTDLTKESIWKNGVVRKDSIQWTTAQHFIDGGFSIVFDDDGAGEAADLVCLHEEDDHIKLVLVHCKFSGGAKAGRRVKDVVEVSSQAIRSAKWPGKFNKLCTHLLNRNAKINAGNRPSHMLAGNLSDITKISQASRFKEVQTQILVVQPGVSKNNLSTEQSQVLVAAITYLKETVGVDLDIICSA